MSQYCFICPTYGQYSYARSSVESFLTHTPGGVALVIDDGHPEFHQFWDHGWNVVSHQFKTHHGLTRSWNFGLRQAKELQVEYTICGNDDILFTPDWYVGPTALLQDDSVGLVGPLSNSPGRGNKLQNVWTYLPGYRPSDGSDQLTRAASYLKNQYLPSDCVEVQFVNGFFMISRTERWWEGAFDAQHVFNPGPEYVLTESERELQKRLRNRGWRNLVSLRAFIFHYRSVTRGEKHKHGMWYRKASFER